MKRFMTSIVILGLLALSGVTISEVRAGVRLRQVPNAPAASPTPSEARAIFYALLDERSVAVENGVYSRIEPLYAHIEGADGLPAGSRAPRMERG